MNKFIVGDILVREKYNDREREVIGISGSEYIFKSKVVPRPFNFSIDYIEANYKIHIPAKIRATKLFQVLK